MTEPQVYISGADGNEVFQAAYIPKQKPPTPANHPSMKAYISTFPPLGQVTEIDHSTTLFTALLEVDPSRAHLPWEVSLCRADEVPTSHWKEVPLDPLKDSSAHPLALQDRPNGLIRLYFTTPLSIHVPTTFTVKFREDSKSSWNWAREASVQGIHDGILLLKSLTSQDDISSDLGDYVEGLNPILKSKNYRSQSPGTTLWAVEAPIEAADGETSNIKDIPFGLPWGKDPKKSFMRLVQYRWRRL